MLLQQLDVARDQLDNLQKRHDDFELKSKAEVKLLVKEVKSLRNSQSELKQELSRLLKEKLEVEVIIHFSDPNNFFSPSKTNFEHLFFRTRSF